MHPRTTATATAATAATGTENGTAATAAAAHAASSAVLLRVERLRHWRAQMRSLRRGRALPRADSCDGGVKHTNGTAYEHETGHIHGAWSMGSQR